MLRRHKDDRSRRELLNPPVAHVGDVDEALVIDDDAAGYAAGQQSYIALATCILGHLHGTEIKLTLVTTRATPVSDVLTLRVKDHNAGATRIQHIGPAVRGSIEGDGDMEVACICSRLYPQEDAIGSGNGPTQVSED